MTGAGTNYTIPSLEGGPAIVLVRPQLAVNIGMCALRSEADQNSIASTNYVILARIGARP